MPIDRVDTLLDALEESQLLTAAQLQECRRDRASFADTRALARHLLQHDWLTPYQVNHVLQGKTGELFLDNYVLLERIGQGGMGQVFRARHRIMDRVVALKIIRPERLANPDLVKRFRREIKLAAQLAHPNIVIAYDAAEQHGTHFLVMEFVEGIDLARFVQKNGRRPVAQASEWVRQVALGLQHAHERGMVHRDVKPANLLLAIKENVVKVLDMGLARLSHGADADQTGAGLTQEGTVMGTPDYMAPEQAEESTGVDIRADIYSLGCTFYFLLAGHAPFPGGTLAQKLRKHAQAEPEPLERQRDDVPAGLRALVRKMMAKRPEDRFQTPGEAAAALDLFCRTGPVLAVPLAIASPATALARPVAVPLSPESLAALQQPTLLVGDPVAQAGDTIPPSGLDSVPSVTLSKPQTPLARAQRTWRRLGRRGQIIAAGSAAVILVLLLMLLLWPHKPRPPIQPPQDLSVLEGLDADKIPREDRPGWQSKELKDIVVAVLGEHRVRIPAYNYLALSPNRKKVAVADGAVIRLVDPRTLRQDHELTGHTGTVLCLAYSANGKFLASGSTDRGMRLWDAESGKLLREFQGAHQGVVLAVALTPDGKQVLSAGDDTRIHIWDASNGERLRTFTGHTTAVRALVVAPDGRTYSAGGTTEVGKDADRDIRIWEVATAKADRAGDTDRLLTGHKGYVNRLELSPDGKRLLAGGNMSEVAVWNLAEGSLTPVSLTSDPANAVGNGTFVGEDRVATFVGGKIRLWVPNGRGGLQDLDPIPPQATASGLAWLPAVPRENRDNAETDNGLLFVMDGTLHVWNLERKKEWRPPLGHTQPARGLTFLGIGDRLVSTGDDRTVRFWDLADLYDPATGWPRESRVTLSSPGTGGNAFLGAPVSADGNLVLTLVNAEKFVTVWVWENNTWNPVRKLEWKDAGDKDYLSAVALSEDGTRTLTAGTDKALRLWDVKRAIELKKIDGLPYLCSVVRFLPEGRAYTWDTAELRLWEGFGEGDKPQPVVIPARGSALEVSPGRELAIVGEGDGHLENLTNLAKGKPSRTPFDWWQKGVISALSLSPNRKRFLAGSGGDASMGPRLALWDLTGDAKPQWWDVRGVPTGLTFAPDGRHAALANPDGTIYIVRLPIGK